MTVGAKGSWVSAAPAGTKLMSLLLVAYATAISLVLFQTITNNRILTRDHGLPLLFVLLQTALVFALGATGVAALDARLLFMMQAASMILFSTTLFRWLFSGGVRSLAPAVMVGILLGGLFRSAPPSCKE